MNTKTNDELRAMVRAGDEAAREIGRRMMERGAVVENRIAALLTGSPVAFAPGDLVFAATTRCECGAGMAYPRESDTRGQWHCSAILLGKADRAVTHSASLPFSFYEMKSEDQPSQRGATTRGADEQRVVS